MSSYAIRSGLDLNRKEFLRDYAKELAELCPNPEKRIVDRLTNDWIEFNSSSIFLPWVSSQKYKEGYSAENVLFYARILTVLESMDIFPPAQVQMAGGGKGGGIPIPGVEVATFVPEGDASGRYLREAKSEYEAKQIVQSSDQGGLADAASGQLPQLRDRTDMSARRIMAALVNLTKRMNIWSRNLKNAHKKDDDKEMPDDVELDFFDGEDEDDNKAPPIFKPPPQTNNFPPINGIKDRDGKIAFSIEYENEEEKSISSLPQSSFSDIEPGPFDGSDEITSNLVEDLDSGEFGELDDPALEAARMSNHPRVRSAIERLDRAAVAIRRRLPWSRLNARQQQQVIELLPPSLRRSDREEVLWQREEPALSWWRRLGARLARIRINWLQKLMWRFLLPVGLLVPGVILYYREQDESKNEDELITIYRALPESNWFKSNLHLFSWVKIVSLTPRVDNYQLLHQVANTELLTFAAQDGGYLWKISQFAMISDYDACVRYFSVFKNTMNYRTAHNTELTNLANKESKKSKVLWNFAIVYVAQATDPRGLPLMSAFFGADVPATQELLEESKKINAPIILEHQTSQRTLKFEKLLTAFENAIKHTSDFRTPWMLEMMALYHSSKFDLTLDKLAFTNVLRDLEINPGRYQDDAKTVLADFLSRYTTKDGDRNNTLPFQNNVQALKYDEDIFLPVKQLLQAMSEFRNDGKMDALSYEFLNRNWERHSAQNVYATFDDAVASFELDDKTKFTLYSLVDALERGLMPFVESVKRDFATQPSDEDGFPEKILDLYNDGPPEQNEMQAVSIEEAPNAVVPRSVGSGRKIMAFGAQVPAVVTTGNIDYKTVPFYRFRNVVLIHLGLVTCVLARNDNTMQVATLNPQIDNDDNKQYAVEIWQKPIEESNARALVLANATWVKHNLDLLFLAAMTIIASFLVAKGPGPKVAYVPLAKIGTVAVGSVRYVATNFIAASFKDKVVVTGLIGAGTVATVYRKEITRAAKFVTKNAAQMIAVIAAVSLLATASDFYQASQGRKRRKL